MKIPKDRREWHKGVVSAGCTVINAPGYPEVVTYARGERMPGEMVKTIDLGLIEGRCTVTFEPRQA